jgi:acyl carrier protein
MSTEQTEPAAAGTVDVEQLRERVHRLARAMSPQPIDEITADTRLVDDLGYDSLRLLELAIALEMEFDLSGISADETVSITTVGGIEEFLLRVLGEGAGAP